MEIKIGIYNKEEFRSTETYKNAIINDPKLELLMKALRDDISIVIESPYIDKFFRDSYYHYFSSKHLKMDRDTIRINLFDSNAKEEDLLIGNYLNESFLGFFVIRPIKGRIIGRTMLSPKAFKEQNFLTCLTRIKTQIMGKDVYVDAFPHSPQDKQYMSCAETTVWAIMEYFGNRYVDYSPISPSKISKVIESSYNARAFPSDGLTTIQISKALKEFGFGTMLYHIKRDRKNEEDVFRTISNYIESGIPVVLSLKSKHGLGHAVIACGHESTSYQNLEELNKDMITNISKLGEYSIWKTSSKKCKYVLMDDNQLPYKMESLYEPTKSYKDTRFDGVYIESAIVPLYSKVYLDSRRAEELVASFLMDSNFGLSNFTLSDSNFVVQRLFLTSSKSFKRSILSSKILTAKQKTVFLNFHFPKFVWICELTDPGAYLKGKVQAKIILDATGDVDNSSILIAQYQKVIYIQRNNGSIGRIETSFPDTDVYQNNLKGEWNEWKAYN
jgi:hypothetical protein